MRYLSLTGGLPGASLVTRSYNALASSASTVTAQRGRVVCYIQQQQGGLEEGDVPNTRKESPGATIPMEGVTR